MHVLHVFELWACTGLSKVQERVFDHCQRRLGAAVAIDVNKLRLPTDLQRYQWTIGQWCTMQCCCVGGRRRWREG